MKVRFYCYQPICSDGTVMNISRNAVLLDASPDILLMYNSYILSALYTDFPEYDPSFCDDVLEQVGRIERGEIDAYEYEGDGFTQHITRDRVRFEHTVFGECPEWPIWYCTLAQYKAALQGYRQFLDMPKSIESELLIELPEGNVSSTDKSGPKGS